MGVISVVSSTTSGAGAGASASVTSLLSPVGIGVGGVFVAGLLIYLLAYLDIVNAIDPGREPARRLGLLLMVPLLLTFSAIVIFRSLAIVL